MSFQPQWVRASTGCYTAFTLAMDRSLRFRVYSVQLIRPIQTCFRYGSGLSGLNLATQSNSLAHYAKGTRSDIAA
jgi:hypothetical protein